MLLEERQNLFARGRSIAADYVNEPKLSQHPACRCGVVQVTPTGIMLYQLQSEWKGATRVDLLRGEKGTVTHRGTDSPIGTSYREQQSNAKRAALAHTCTLRKNT